MSRAPLPASDLAGRVIRAGGWAGGLRLAERGFGVVRTIILARLLAPSDFGLFGVALVVMSALEMLSQAGLNQALIHRRGSIEAHLDTAWTLQLARGILLALVLVVGAGPMALFFNEPGAAALMRVMGGAILLQGLTNIGVVHLERDLDFRRRFLYLFGGAAADFIAAIAAAIVLRNAWALALGYVAGAAVRAAASYAVHDYRPRLSIDRVRAADLWGYGRWVWMGAILILIATLGDDVFIARALGVTALALYQMAYLFSNALATEISHVISAVTFPTFSNLQERRSELARAFLTALDANFSLLLPAAAGLLILGADFVRVVLGPQWAGMVPALQILTVGGVFRAVLATGGALFQGAGQPAIGVRMNAIRVIVLLALLFPLGLGFGIAGVSMAVVASVVAPLPVWWSAVVGLLGVRAPEIFRLLVPTVVATAAMVGIVIPLRLLFEAPGPLAFVALVFSGVALYGYVRVRLGSTSFLTPPE